jgi:hypothetical protein
MPSVQDKTGDVIKGDMVVTKIRGGKREGEVYVLSRFLLY